MRFLLKEFKSPAAEAPSKRNYLFRFQEYDEIVLLKANTSKWRESLHDYIKKQLTSGRNLTYIARRAFAEGRITEHNLSIMNPDRADGKWTYLDVIDFLKEGEESQEICVERLLEKYGASNTSLRLECGIYFSKQDVSDYDGLIIDFVNATGLSNKIESRFRSFRNYVDAHKIGHASRFWKISYDVLKTEAGQALDDHKSSKKAEIQASV